MTQPGWIAFRRADAGVVIDMVRAVAQACDPGLHGDGVEVVIEAPKLGWFARLFDNDHRPDQARLVVTKSGGVVSYPFDVRLIADGGGRAARRVPLPPGWARSNSAGLAFLVQKGRPGAPYAWGELVGGAIAALVSLRRRAPQTGWRVTVDRSIRRDQMATGPSFSGRKA